MIELKMLSKGDGSLVPASPLDRNIVLTRLEPGKAVKVAITKQRSVRQNNMFHALVQAAHDNQRAGPQCETWEHLKAWLLIRAGHCHEQRIPLGNMSAAAATQIMAPLASFTRRVTPVIEYVHDRKRNELVMRSAKSWKFSEADHERATEVLDRVIAIICADIVPGVDPMTLLDWAGVGKRAAKKLGVEYAQA